MAMAMAVEMSGDFFYRPVEMSESERKQGVRYEFDLTEVGIRVLKYAMEGIVVTLAAYTIPTVNLDWSELAQVGAIAVATFAILDFFAPTISKSARMGAGAGIGANLVGFPGRLAAP